MDNGYTEIEFGSQKVPVLKGGYYDRYRMNPDLILEAPLPTMHAAKPQSRLGSMNMIHQRNGGPLSELLDGLGASTLVRLEVVKDVQLVLNLPELMGEGII